MMKIEYINIAQQFSTAPGLRFKSQGPKSGEEFRENFLEPLFKREHEPELIEVNLDGGYGYSASFLEEAFGGLIRTLKRDVRAKFRFISNEEPTLIDRIHLFMSKAYANLNV